MGQIFPYPDSTRGPNLARLLNGFFFFRGSDPPLRAPRALWAVVLQGLFCGPIKKKKCLPDIDFLGNQTGGEKEHSRKPIIFSATNRSEQSETNKTHYFLSNQ